MMTGRNYEMGKTPTTVPRGSLKICLFATEKKVLFSLYAVWS